MAAFLFRRDFRVRDNTGFLSLFNEATRSGLQVLPLFFFNPQQAEKKNNPYFSNSSFQFLCQSLVDLNEQQLMKKLVCLRGTDEECLNALSCEGIQIKVLGFNLDFTPFALQRDQVLTQFCLSSGIQVVSAPQDYTLFGLNDVETGSGGVYSVFTPYYRRVMADYVANIPSPQDGPGAAALQRSLLDGPARFVSHKRWVDPGTAYVLVPEVTDVGGRAAGLAVLQQMKNFTRYDEERDGMAGDRTTHLSPHMKFGTVSVRECWAAVAKALGVGHALARQLIWREFYSMLLYHHPHLTQGQLSTPGVTLKNLPFQRKYDGFLWKWEEKHFEAFKLGRTGVPLVDAAVRCLTATGWCPNRGRMIIANYLVKTLGVDWREGEKWYASLAVDYDVANNSGGWLWSSGQGADAQPFFRTFNPFRQSARFDKDCQFIYRWVPELAGVPPTIIHNWEELCESASASGTKSPKSKEMKEKTMLNDVLKRYPRPIVCTKSYTNAVIDAFKAYNNTK